MENPFREEQLILNDKFKLITMDNEYRMSQWVKGFGVEDINGNEILAFNGSLNLNEFEEGENVLRVRFCVYPNREPEYMVDINPFNGTFVYEFEEFPLVDLKKMFK